MSHLRRSPDYRIGFGFDAHELHAGRRLVLGGVHLPGRRGLAGHSDADVLLHALTDALLGAAALPDIGTLFPDTDAATRDADSAELLSVAWRRVRKLGFRLANADCVLVCDAPKIAPHAPAIRERIAAVLKADAGNVGLKAKTTEGTRLALKGRSIAAMVTVLLVRG